MHVASSAKAHRHNGGGGGGGGRKFKVNAAIRTSLRHILSQKLVQQRRFGAKFTCESAKSHRPYEHGNARLAWHEAESPNYVNKKEISSTLRMGNFVFA